MIAEQMHLESRIRRVADPAWPWVALLLLLAVLGLVHDLNNATVFGLDSAEAGRYVERQEEFQSDVTSVGWGRKLGFACLLLVGFYCAATIPRGHRIQWNLMTLLILLGMMWTLSSVLWSIHPEQTMRELVRLFAYLFVAAMLAWRFDPRSLCLILTSTLIASLVISTGVEVLTGGFRPWITDYRLSGTMHSAAVGYYAMLVATASYAMARRQHNRAWWCLFCASVAVLVLSKALTSFVAGLGGIAAIHLVDKSRRSLLFGACCATTVIAAVLVATAATDFWANDRVGRVDTLGRDYDFTSFNGRIPLWEILWEKLEERRLAGFGYAGFWVTKHVDSLHDELHWFPNHAHSAYLGTIVHVGFVGLALLLAVSLLAFRCNVRRIRLTGAPEFYVFASWLAAGFVIGIAETSFVEPRDIGLWAAAIVFSCIVSIQPAIAVGQHSIRSRVSLQTSGRSTSEGHFA